MDVVVTVPRGGWDEWLSEGGLPGDLDLDREYGFVVGTTPKNLLLKERVYIVAGGKLRGYAPLVRFGDGRQFGGRPGQVALVRRGGAVAVTIPLEIEGFRGFRYRWWRREVEVPFPSWRLL